MREDLYCQAIYLFRTNLFSGVVVPTKKHTDQDQDTKEGLRVNRSALIGQFVLHTNRERITISLSICKTILKYQKLDIAIFNTIENFSEEFVKKLNRNEEIKINWVYPSSISAEINALLEIYSKYQKQEPLGLGKVRFSHDQAAFRLLDSKSNLAKVASIFKELSLSVQDLNEQIFPVSVRQAIIYLTRCKYSEEEIRSIFSFLKTLFPESKICNICNIEEFVSAILNEYTSEDGFLRKFDGFVSKVNNTAGGLGVISWNLSVLKKLTQGICDIDNLPDLSSDILGKLSPNFIEYIRSQIKSSRLESRSQIERFLVNNGIIFQEYLSGKDGSKTEKSINFLQLEVKNESLKIPHFFPIIASDQIIINHVHVGNLIQLNDEKFSIISEIFSGTSFEFPGDLIGAAYAVILYVAFSTVIPNESNNFLVSEVSDFSSISMLYSGIDLIEKYNKTTGQREMKITEINPRFTGCIQPIARALQESIKRKSAIQDLFDEKKLVSLTLYFNTDEINEEVLKNDCVRKEFPNKFINYLYSNLFPISPMLISFQTDPNSARISYCYFVDSSDSKEKIMGDIYRQQKVVFDFTMVS
jgi:hypothetical protein